jgi:hypothetical protein
VVNFLLGLFAIFWFPALVKSFRSNQCVEAESAEEAAYVPITDEAPIDADSSVCPERKASFFGRE